MSSGEVVRIGHRMVPHGNFGGEGSKSSISIFCVNARNNPVC